MSERKVLNKYYPPDFDPSQIPKMRIPKNRTFSIRIMAPFNMRCNTCGEYIYKGKKFNSRKENVDFEDYLGLRIFRFYIKCPRCVSEIAFKTDLKNTDYALEAGATRLFEAEKLAQKMAEQERKEKEEEELNPMKVLENRTKQSRNEIEQLDTLEELRDLNARHAHVDIDSMLEQHQLDGERLKQLQEEEEEQMIRQFFGDKEGRVVKRLVESDSEEDEDEPIKKKQATENPTAILAEETADISKKSQTKKSPAVWERSVGSLSSRNSLAKLVVKKKSSTTSTQPQNLVNSGQQHTDNCQASLKKPTSNPSATVVTNSVDNRVLEGQVESGINEKDSGFPRSVSTSDGVSNTKDSDNAHRDEIKREKPVSGLGLLGNYSDSDSATSSD